MSTVYQIDYDRMIHGTLWAERPVSVDRAQMDLVAVSNQQVTLQRCVRRVALFPGARYDHFMANQRLDLRRNADGHWTVYDVFTGQTAVVDGVELNVLEADEADNIVHLLNSKDADREGASGSRRGPPFE